MEFVIVTGLSGAGKSRAVDALEDIGFYCVDNMPPKLLPKFAELCMQSQNKLSKVAFGMDVRGGELFNDLFDGLDDLKRQCGDYKILFLECDDQVLARRYKETRRQHPLAAANDNSVLKAIAAERLLLKPVRARTDYLVDTSHLSTSQLKERITSLFMEDSSQAMTIQCMSFGFKYGYPAEADLVMDVRCLPNPFYVDELKRQTGLDQPVRAFVLDREEIADYFCDLLAKGEIPLRVTHNDTKLNNIMIDNKTGKGICVIDLDTVMPGLAMNDFGDSIRFGASTAAEDEQNLEKVSCSMDLFDLYAKGYIEGCAGKLTQREIELMPMGAKTMTYECGMRFLTDYLQGDTYFKIHREGHNLDRCRTQFRLVEDMEKKWYTMQDIVNKYSNS